MNTILFIISIILVFGTLVLINRFFGKEGVIGFMGVVTILANILICKCVDLFGMGATLGNILFASNFLATDILTECNDKKTARKGVLFALVASCGFLLTSQIAMLFRPNDIDTAQNAFQTLFTLTPRITLASVSLFVFSNVVDINLYDFMKQKTGDKFIWLRNNVCTILCNGTENFLFYFIAFARVFKTQELISMAVTATIIEIIVALCDTPWLYIARKAKYRGE